MRLSVGSKVFLVVLVAAGALFYFALSRFNAADAPAESIAEGERIAVTVPEGAGASDVGDLLAERGVIDSATIFNLLARFDDRASRIRPGEYELVAGMNTNEILETLAAGPPLPDTFRVAIPEGYTVKQTLERIAASEGSPFEEQELREALAGVPLPAWVPVDQLPEGAERYEGLLFPATYEFFVTESPQEVLGDLVAETDEVVTSVTPPEGMTHYEVLIVASLIEREARLPDEQPVISSVIHNRLAAPMRLQVDATVQYAQGEQKAQLLYEDLEIDSAWNTYEVDGLPPTPIAAPGRSALEAAANPADTDFRFYVVCDPDSGQHAFARTNEAHNANRADFERVREEGGSYCDDAATG